MFNLTKEDKKLLLKIARESIEAAVKGQPEPEYNIQSQTLNEKAGVFVTLKKHGQLRGCIGYVYGVKPLWEATKDVAVEAALHDPRFYPVQPAELDEIELEISVLTPLRRIKSPEEVVVGRHGVLIKRGFNQGLLLPQVATEEGWDRETFLDHTCLKAGLYPGCWRDKDVEIYVFEAIIFSERDFTSPAR